MKPEPKLEPLACPLCHSPHINIARDLKGEPQQAFCKACGCQAPIAAWNTRTPASDVRRQALEEAAKVADQKSADLLRRQKEAWPHVHIGALQECCLQIATEIRALAQPAEETKP